MAMENDIFDLFEGMFEEDSVNTTKQEPQKSSSQVEAPKKAKTKKKKSEKPASTSAATPSDKPKTPKVDSFEKAIRTYFEQECITDPEFAAKYRNGTKTAADACKWLKDYHKKHAVGGCYASDNDADNLLAKKFIMDDTMGKSKAEAKAVKEIGDAVKNFQPAMTAEELPEENDIIDLFDNL